MKLTSAWLAQVSNGQLQGADVPFSGAAIDSRRVRSGELFVALVGEHADGHDYVAQAQAAGAVAALVQRPVECDLPQIIVADVAEAMTQAAAAWRDSLDTRVVGITGSCGKTTVKDLVAAILKQCGDCLVTEGNYNNELGVPMTLLRMRPEHRFAVIEMGASRRGDIEYLAKLAKPQVGLVTNAGAAHIEHFGSIQVVAETKGEMFSALPADGVAIINADDGFAPLWETLAGERARLRFSTNGAVAELRGERQAEQLNLDTPKGAVRCQFALPGRHNLANALAACAVAYALDVSPEQMAAGLEQARPPAGRLTRHTMRGGWTLIDDSYNANPNSLAAAIEVLANEGVTSWLVLGDMAELGPEAEEIHFNSGRLAREGGISRLFTLGPLSAHAARGFGAGASQHDDHEQLTEVIRDQVGAGMQVLVKGSRSARMEQVVSALMQDPGSLEEAA